MTSTRHRTISRRCVPSLLAVAACAGAPVEPVSSPRAVLAQLLLASKSGDLEAVRNLVYPYRPYEGTDVPGANAMAWEIVVATMKNQRSDYAGDWSYCDDALSRLLTRSDLVFGPSPGGQPTAGAPTIRPEDLRYFEDGRCHVWIARENGGWKLLFWEGLNTLLH